MAELICPELIWPELKWFQTDILMSTKTRAFIREKNKVARNEKQKNLHRFSYDKNVANFEGFH